MTVKELYEWAVKNGAENFDIEVAYRDEGGFYYGYDNDLWLSIKDREKEYTNFTEKVVTV